MDVEGVDADRVSEVGPDVTPPALDTTDAAPAAKLNATHAQWTPEWFRSWVGICMCLLCICVVLSGFSLVGPVGVHLTVAHVSAVRRGAPFRIGHHHGRNAVVQVRRDVSSREDVWLFAQGYGGRPAC